MEKLIKICRTITNNLVEGNYKFLDQKGALKRVSEADIR